MTDIRALLAAASRLAPGAILSVGRPNSLFQACLANLGWPAAEHLRHVSANLLTGSQTLTALAQQAWPHSGYRKQIVGERTGRLLLASGELVDQVTIDSFYGDLRNCVAIEVDAQSWPCLRAGGELIRRCRPLLAIERSREAAPQVAALLEDYGYVVADGMSGEIAQAGAFPSDYVLAVPKDGAHPVGGDGRTASLRRLLALRRQEIARDPLNGWSYALDAADVGLLPGTSEIHDGRLRWWTGPGRKTRMFVWAPLEGLYRLTVEIADLSYPAELGLTLTRSLEKGVSVHSNGAIELTLSISRSECRDAFPVILMTPEPWHRRVSNRDCKVGAAISGLRLERLGVF